MSGPRILALTPAAAALGARLAAALPASRLFLPPALQPRYPQAEVLANLRAALADAFKNKNPLICIMATGIVVRLIAPLLRHKAADPPVVVVDEKGRFAISLVSGHLGGANDLARQVAAILGATPVITTATDVQELPAFDSLAARHGWRVENLAAVKRVHAALLAGQPVAVWDDGGYLGQLLSVNHQKYLCFLTPDPDQLPPGPAVYIGYREYHWPADWLRLRPPVLAVGIGCNRGTSAREILDLLTETFSRYQLARPAIKTLATGSRKRAEPGLVAAARELGVSLLWYPEEELAAIPVPHPSAIVAAHVGTPSICEAAALKAAHTRELVVPKQKSLNTTLAVAVAGWP